MGLADIPALVLQSIEQGIASPVGDLADSIAESPVAEPGPPTGVRPFGDADATEAALMAKLGARVFQRARERRIAADKAAKEQAQENYRAGQMRALLANAATNRSRLDETERHNRAMEARPTGNPPEEMLEVDPDTGKPLPAKMTRDQWLRYRGQNLAGTRATAAANLRRELETRRQGAATRSSETLEANRYLDNLPGMSEIATRSWAEALAEADRVRASSGKKPFRLENKQDVALREQVARGLFNDILLRNAAAQDSLRRRPLEKIRSAARVDSTTAAQPIDLPDDFEALFEDLD